MTLLSEEERISAEEIAENIEHVGYERSCRQNQFEKLIYMHRSS